MADTELPPAPLTPADCNLQDFQYMELDVVRLRDSKFAATPNAEAFRAGLLLWCASWHQVPAASLPDDDVELAKLAGYGQMKFSVREWRKVRNEALTGFIKCSDGRLYHTVVAEKANAAWNSRLLYVYEKLKDRVRKENKEREKQGWKPIIVPSFDAWISAGRPSEIPPPPPEIPPESGLRGNGEGEGKGEGEGDSFVGGPAAPPPTPAPSPTPAPPPPTPTPKPQTRGQRKCPEGFEVTQAMVQWAAKECPQLDPQTLERETARWRDYTYDRAITDWPAAWRNWMRGAVDRLNRRLVGNGGQLPQETAGQRQAREGFALLTGGRASAKPPGAHHGPPPGHPASLPLIEDETHAPRPPSRLPR